MAKRSKNKMALAASGMPFFVDSSKLKAITSRLKVVPWARIDNVEIHTCGIDEEALGLTEYIAGWCERGYYVRFDRTPQQARQHMAKIEWLRVAYIGARFGIRPERGVLIISDTPVWWVTEQRYMRLMKRCMKEIPEDKFKAEVAAAIRRCQQAGQRPIAKAGTLEETH